MEEDPGLDAHIESPGFDHQLEEDESAVSQEDPDEENKIQEEDIYEGDSDEENGVEAVYNGLLSPFKKPSTRASAIKRHQKIPNENMAKFYKEEEKMVKELSKTDPEKFGDLLPRHRSLEKNLRILGYCLSWRHKNVQLPVLANKARSILEEQAALRSKILLCNMKMKEVTV